MFFAVTAQGRADTIFSSFGPGQSYPTNQYWYVGYSPGYGAQVDAFSFVPTETVTLTSADLALAQLIAPFTPLNVYIESDASGTPGSILDTLTQVGSFDANSAVVNFTCLTCSVLDAGTTYWIVGQQTDPSTQTAWLYSPSSTGAWYYDGTDSATGPWTVADSDHIAAFDVNGTVPVSPVPEPASFFLLGSGLLCLMAVGRRRLLARA